jgi:hypothetical protein
MKKKVFSTSIVAAGLGGGALLALPFLARGSAQAGPPLAGTPKLSSVNPDLRLTPRASTGGGGDVAGGGGIACSYDNLRLGTPIPASQKDEIYPFYAEAADDFILTDPNDPNDPPLNECILDSVVFAVYQSVAGITPAVWSGVKLTVYSDRSQICPAGIPLDPACQRNPDKGPAGFPVDIAGGERQHLPCCAEDPAAERNAIVCELKVPMANVTFVQIGPQDFEITVSGLAPLFDCRLEKNKKYWIAPAPVFPFDPDGPGPLFNGQSFLYTSLNAIDHPAQQIFLLLGLPWSTSIQQVWPNTDLYLAVTAIKAPPSTGEVQFYTDPAAFEVALQNAGKVSKAFWEFKPHVLPPASAVGLDDILDINSHGLNPNDPWTDPAGKNLWPPEVDNVQFSGNQTPQGPLTPRGNDGLAFVTPGFAGNQNNALVANFFVDSFDIISGPPAGDNHTAIGLELIDFFSGGLVHITVYDKSDQELAKFDVNVPPPPGKAFLGILRKDRETIGRIDVWDPANGAEGISSISLWQNPVSECTFFLDKDQFEAFNCADGKRLKGIETFEESNIPPLGKVPLPAPLQGNVPNVDPAGIGFPDGLTEKNIIILDNIFPGPNPPVISPSGSPFALYVIGEGFIGSNSKKIGEDLFLNGIHASLDLIFTEPNHTGVGFELSRFDGFPIAGWHITVYDKQDVPMGKFLVPPPSQPEPSKSFFGVWCPNTIGRINIFDEAGPAPDAIDNIQMYVEPGPPSRCPWDTARPGDPPPGPGTPDGLVGINDLIHLLANWGPCPGCPLNCPWDTAQPGDPPPGPGTPDGLVGINDLIHLLANWGPCPTQNACDFPGICGTHLVCGIGTPFNCYCFEVDNDPVTGACIQDFFCADVLPCPPTGCPPGFVCVTDSCCGPAFCAPIIKCDQPLSAPKSGSGLTGSGRFVEAAAPAAPAAARRGESLTGSARAAE